MVNNSAGAPLGVFDSGVGGLTVARELWRQLPHESLIYVGDTARMPYGGRTSAELIAFNREIISWLAAQGAKAVVAACNTSSALVLPKIAGEYQIPLIGVVEPGAKAAAAATRNGRVGLLATAGTVQSGAYAKALAAVQPGVILTAQACPRLVPLIETGRSCSSEAREAVAEYLAPLLAEKVDTVVLGCTHYPFLAGIIRELAGPTVRLINPAEETALATAAMLHRAGLASSGPRRDDAFFTSGDPKSFQALASLLLGRKLPEAVRTDFMIRA